MPQSPHRLRNDLKCVEWDVKPYYTLTPFNSYTSLVLNPCILSQKVKYFHINIIVIISIIIRTLRLMWHKQTAYRMWYIIKYSQEEELSNKNVFSGL